MKAWLVTWKGVGNHACVKNPVAAILNSRLGSERVRRIVERTYVNARFSLSERLHYASSRRWRNPYPARFSSLHGVTWRGRVYCGDNPELFARQVRNIRVVENGTDDGELVWEEIPPPKVTSTG